MWDRWRTKTMNWLAFGLVTCVIFAIFIGLLLWNQADRKQALSKSSSLQVALSLAESERNNLQNDLDSIGSKPYIETRARSELSYLRPGEIRFEIENAELLDNYTEEEWQRLIGDKATLGD